jgi:hypothetical protein
MDNLYDTDIVAWAERQVMLLRSGRLSEIDVLNIAEEIEDVIKREKRELTNRLAILMAHLLKWYLQPERRGHSWRSTIRTQRKEIARLLREAPSLRPVLADKERVEIAWGDAGRIFHDQTGIDEYPDTPAWTVKQMLDPDFLPD